MDYDTYFKTLTFGDLFEVRDNLKRLSDRRFPDVDEHLHVVELEINRRQEAIHKERISE